VTTERSGTKFYYVYFDTLIYSIHKFPLGTEWKWTADDEWSTHTEKRTTTEQRNLYGEGVTQQEIYTTSTNVRTWKIMNLIATTDCQTWTCKQTARKLWIPTIALWLIQKNSRQKNSLLTIYTTNNWCRINNGISSLWSSEPPLLAKGWIRQ
jgi:hypothetical protein